MSFGHCFHIWKFLLILVVFSFSIQIFFWHYYYFIFYFFVQVKKIFLGQVFHFWFFSCLNNFTFLKNVLMLRSSFFWMIFHFFFKCWNTFFKHFTYLGIFISLLNVSVFIFRPSFSPSFFKRIFELEKSCHIYFTLFVLGRKMKTNGI